MTNQLDKLLSEVEASLEGVTEDWSLGLIEERKTWCINSPCPPSDSGLTKWPVCEFYGNNFGSNSDYKDCNFVLKSRTTVPKLLEIVKELKECAEMINAVEMPDPYGKILKDNLARCEEIAGGKNE